MSEAETQTEEVTSETIEKSKKLTKKAKKKAESVESIPSRYSSKIDKLKKELKETKAELKKINGFHDEVKQNHKTCLYSLENARIDIEVLNEKNKLLANETLLFRKIATILVNQLSQAV